MINIMYINREGYKDLPRTESYQPHHLLFGHRRRKLLRTRSLMIGDEGQNDASFSSNLFADGLWSFWRRLECDL
ncbi:hypothetical protein cypCar_00038365 [Cyprinus carpio]|nr:hypothetical protein cypCar_00038365 [Cyprinus carpio]